MGSFWVNGRIFATVPDDQHVRIMLGDDPPNPRRCRGEPEAHHS